MALTLGASSFIHVQRDIVQNFGSVPHIGFVSAVCPAPCPEQREQDRILVSFIYSANVHWRPNVPGTVEEGQVTAPPGLSASL